MSDSKYMKYMADGSWLLVLQPYGYDDVHGDTGDPDVAKEISRAGFYEPRSKGAAYATAYLLNGGPDVLPC